MSHFTTPAVVATAVHIVGGKVVSFGAHYAALTADLLTIGKFCDSFGEQGFAAMFPGGVPEGDGLCLLEAKLICSDCGGQMGEVAGRLNLKGCREAKDPVATAKKSIGAMCEELLADLARSARIAEAFEQVADLVAAYYRAAERPESRRPNG